MNKYYDNESFWKFGEWQLTAEKCGSIQPSAQDCHDSITISSSHPSYSGDTNNRPKLGSSTRIINRSFIESVINFEISSDDHIEIYLNNVTKASFDIGNIDFVIAVLFEILKEEIGDYYLQYCFNDTTDGQVIQSETKFTVRIIMVYLVV